MTSSDNPVTPYCPNCGVKCRDPWHAMTQASPPPDEPTQPKLEKVMRQAVFASTEHCYDLTPPDEMVSKLIRELRNGKGLTERKSASGGVIRDAWLHDVMQRAADVLQSIGPLMRERVTKWSEGGTIFDALCQVRRRNAGDFSGERTAREWKAYDTAVLDCFKEIEAALKRIEGQG